MKHLLLITILNVICLKSFSQSIIDRLSARVVISMTEVHPIALNTHNGFKMQLFRAIQTELDSISKVGSNVVENELKAYIANAAKGYRNSVHIAHMIKGDILLNLFDKADDFFALEEIRHVAAREGKEAILSSQKLLRKALVQDNPSKFNVDIHKTSQKINKVFNQIDTSLIDDVFTDLLNATNEKFPSKPPVFLGTLQRLRVKLGNSVSSLTSIRTPSTFARFLKALL